MATRARTLFLSLLLGFGAQAWAGVPPGFAPGRMVLLERLIAGGEQDPGVHAEYATGLSSTGRCVQAEPHFDLGADLANGARANCLREQGQARQAAALREAEILASATPFLHHLGQAQDLRVAGDLLGAEQAGLKAASLQPQSKRMLAFWVELALDQGDLAQAQGILALSEALPGRAPSELLLAQARSLAHEGAWQEAEVLTRQAGGRGRQPTQAACLRVRILIEEGDAPLALMVLQQPRFDDREELCLLRAHAAVHRALGEPENALEWEMLIWALAPQGTLDTEAIPRL